MTPWSRILQAAMIGLLASAKTATGRAPVAQPYDRVLALTDDDMRVIRPASYAVVSRRGTGLISTAIR